MAHGNSNKSSAMIAYICYLIGILIPISSIVGVIVNHIKRSDTRGTWVESHHRWMMRTFWFSFLWGFFCGILMVIPVVNLIAWIAFIGVGIWYIYRVIRGFLNFNDEKPMYGEVFGAQTQTESAGA